MSHENAQFEAAGELTLPPLLDVAAAPALVNSLRQYAAATADGVLLDGKLVERVSTLCLQALLAIAQDTQVRGIQFQLRHPSPVLATAIADLGLASGLGL